MIVPFLLAAWGTTGATERYTYPNSNIIRATILLSSFDQTNIIKPLSIHLHSLPAWIEWEEVY